MNNVNNDYVKFARNLVKGKIAETIFAQMLRETGKFTVLEFGYEKIVPELVRTGDSQYDGLVDTLRSSPDFAVINKTNGSVKLIEVKYQRSLSKTYTLKAATRMHESWNPSYLFIATQEGFYFDEITKIIGTKGNITPLDHPFISSEVQAKYLKILVDFEADN